MKYRKQVFVLSAVMSLLILSGCSFDEFKQSAQDSVNNKVEQAKQEVANKVEESVKEAAKEKVDSIGRSIESTIDPKLGEIRKNMDNIKQAAITYYKINKKMPQQEKIAAFFDKTFSEMKIEYKTSVDKTRAFIIYRGKDYTKEKVPDITVEPDKE